MSKTFGDDCDWRGTKIEVGQHVLYGAPGGRSISMVEAEVVGFTKTGRVNLKVTRRAYGSGTKDVVHVGNDRLTVINANTLPPTTLPSQADANAERMRSREERQAHEATHSLKSVPRYPNYENRSSFSDFATLSGRSQAYQDAYTQYEQAMKEWRANPCFNCGASSLETRHQDCPV